MSTIPAPVEGDKREEPAEGDRKPPESTSEIEVEQGGSPTSSPTPERNSSTFREAEKESKHYHFSGNVFAGTTSFGDERAADRTTTWAKELKEVDLSKKRTVGEEADTVFHAACEAWARFRIVVLRYHPGEQRRAEGLMLRIACWAREMDRECRLLSTGNDLALSLKDLSSPDHWPPERRRSVIYLARRKEPHTARFFSTSNGVEVEGLRQRLEERDTRLLVSLAAEWDAVEGADAFDDSICTLEVASDKPVTAPQPGPEAESALDVIPRIVAGLFAGLKVGEYRELVDQFLPNDTVAATVPPAAAEGQKDGAPATPPPTRHQRWIAGDIDRVLAELGIRYDTPPMANGTGAGENRAPGYFVANDISPYADPGWIVMNYPALLASRMDALLARYLGRQASQRYQEAFLTCLARLDAAGVHLVDAKWLMTGWNAALDEQAHSDSATRNLCRLVEYVQAGRNDSQDRFANSVVEGFADMAVELELRFQQEVGEQPLQQALSDLASAWSLLSNSPQTSAAVKRFSERQAAALWTLLRLARSWPMQVARATAAMLTRVADPESPWRRAGEDERPLDEVPRGAALNLEYLLSQMLDGLPELWASFAKGVADAYAGPVHDAMAQPSAWERASAQARQIAIDGQRLALTCLYGLAPRVYGSDEQTSQQVVRALCLGIDDAANDGTILGRLLAMSYLPVSEEPLFGPIGDGSASLADIVRFLRGVALVLRDDESLSPEEASDALARVSSSLRALWPAQARRALIAQARDSLESQSLMRDHFETVRDGDALASMRKRIRATQAVLRSLGAVK